MLIFWLRQRRLHNYSLLEFFFSNLKCPLYLIYNVFQQLIQFTRDNMAIALEIILFNLVETNSGWNFLGGLWPPATPVNKNVREDGLNIQDNGLSSTADLISSKSNLSADNLILYGTFIQRSVVVRLLFIFRNLVI